MSHHTNQKGIGTWKKQCEGDYYAQDAAATAKQLSFTIPDTDANSALAGRNFKAARKVCCDPGDSQADGPCNDGRQTWLGIRFVVWEMAGMVALLAACACMCGRACFVHARAAAFTPSLSSRGGVIRERDQNESLVLVKHPGGVEHHKAHGGYSSV